MSNSYKKAIYKDGYGSTWKPYAKRMAARVVRRYEGPIPDRSWYKRLFSQYEICDFISDRLAWEGPRAMYRGDPHPSIKRFDDGIWYVTK